MVFYCDSTKWTKVESREKEINSKKGQGNFWRR
jgi:hypothetical protein